MYLQPSSKILGTKSNRRAKMAPAISCGSWGGRCCNLLRLRELLPPSNTAMASMGLLSSVLAVEWVQNQKDPCRASSPRKEKRTLQQSWPLSLPSSWAWSSPTCTIQFHPLPASHHPVKLHKPSSGVIQRRLLLGDVLLALVIQRQLLLGDVLLRPSMNWCWLNASNPCSVVPQICFKVHLWHAVPVYCQCWRAQD